MTEPIDGFWGVVPAGGAGTRLWPLSRAGRPKFLLDLTGSGRSLLQATVDRLTPLVADRLVVVTGARHTDAVCEQLPTVISDRVLVEPSGRDSMAAIGWAAAVVERTDPDGIIGSFAADHVITEPDLFQRAVAEAVEVARTGMVVTLGIQPSYPATGFGYINSGKPLSGFPTARSVAAFVEKPDAATAADYLASGEYRWNAGMFVVRAATLLDLLHRWHPALADGLRALAAEPGRLGELWDGLERIAIDYAVAEPAAREGLVAVVPAQFGWDDIGDVASLAEVLPGDGSVTVLGDGELVTAVDATGLVVPGSGRQVAVVGLDDVVVVDTPDAVLVVHRDQAQRVKQVVDALRAAGRSDLL